MLTLALCQEIKYVNVIEKKVTHATGVYLNLLKNGIQYLILQRKHQSLPQNAGKCISESVLNLKTVASIQSAPIRAHFEYYPLALV